MARTRKSKSKEVVEKVIIGETHVQVQHNESEVKSTPVITHIVKRGDTILSIANMYHKNPQSLNYLEGQLAVGRRIYIK